jgi:peroxiredoxin Q/BCP
MASKPQPLAAGEVAPDFSVTASDGSSVSLSDLRGRLVALYFYPKDATPGCTKQACNLQANLAELAEHDIVVIGVSPDDDASHQRFSDSHGLSFPLVADPERTIIDAYGVWGEKVNYGRTFEGLARTTFLIGPDGVIRHVFKRPRVADHAAEILSKL